MRLLHLQAHTHTHLAAPLGLFWAVLLGPRCQSRSAAGRCYRASICRVYWFNSLINQRQRSPPADLLISLTPQCPAGVHHPQPVRQSRVQLTMYHGCASSAGVCPFAMSQWNSDVGDCRQQATKTDITNSNTKIIINFIQNYYHKNNRKFYTSTKLKACG